MSVRQIVRLGAIAAPPSLVAAWAMTGAAPSLVAGALAASVVVSGALAWSAQATAQRRLRTLTAVLAAYRGGDYAIRARREASSGFDEVVAELNQLGDVLRGQRLGELEAWTLLRKVMAEVDVVVVAVDEEKRIRLANDVAAKILGQSSTAIVGEPAERYGLLELLGGEVPRVAAELHGTPGPWELRRGTFRLAGEPQTLLVLSDVSRALRANERDAWRRLVRVMGHEINNSLGPIRSISDTLRTILERESRPSDWESDLRDGLGVIGRRAEALGRFMTSYAALARLPAPKKAPFEVAALAAKVAALETRVPVDVEAGPEVRLIGDADQLEQALINLVKNAAEACLAEGDGGRVRLRWSSGDGELVVTIEDDGPGVDETANLFVPFFTTKTGGSGIGLALSRQIVEGHDGKLSLETRKRDARGAGDAAGGNVGPKGAVARISLPLVVA